MQPTLLRHLEQSWLSYELKQHDTHCTVQVADHATVGTMHDLSARSLWKSAVCGYTRLPRPQGEMRSRNQHPLPASCPG